jgi:hypothetical protein
MPDNAEDIAGQTPRPWSDDMQRTLSGNIMSPEMQDIAPATKSAEPKESYISLPNPSPEASKTLPPVECVERKPVRSAGAGAEETSIETTSLPGNRDARNS